jgi:hypothetical protein
MCLTVQDSKGFFWQWWIKNHWVYGLWPLSCILQTRKQHFRSWICFHPQLRKRHLLCQVPYKKLTSITEEHMQSQSHITTDSLGVRRPSGDRDQFFFLLEIFFRQLWVCYSVASSLMRGQVCNLLLLLFLASAVTLGLPSLTRGQVCLLSISVSHRLTIRRD